MTLLGLLHKLLLQNPLPNDVEPTRADYFNRDQLSRSLADTLHVIEALHDSILCDSWRLIDGVFDPWVIEHKKGLRLAIDANGKLSHVVDDTELAALKSEIQAAAAKPWPDEATVELDG